MGQKVLWNEKYFMRAKEVDISNQQVLKIRYTYAVNLDIKINLCTEYIRGYVGGWEN